jgi:hypothetical protein
MLCAKTGGIDVVDETDDVIHDETCRVTVIVSGHNDVSFCSGNHHNTYMMYTMEHLYQQFALLLVLSLFSVFCTFILFFLLQQIL